jgi:hypothetical protein
MGEQMIENCEQKRRCFAGSRLGLACDVFASERRWQSLCLDFGTVFEAGVVEPCKQLRFQGKVGKSGFGEVASVFHVVLFGRLQASWTDTSNQESVISVLWVYPAHIRCCSDRPGLTGIMKLSETSGKWVLDS